MWKQIPQLTNYMYAVLYQLDPSIIILLWCFPQIEGSNLHMVRRDLDGGEVHIEYNDSTDKWLVLRKVLDASRISLQVTFVLYQK